MCSRPRGITEEAAAMISRQLICKRRSWVDQEPYAGLPSYRALSMPKARWQAVTFLRMAVHGAGWGTGIRSVRRGELL